MSDKHNILERIRKLMALGKGEANEHEADSALKFAARLMAQHGISEDDVRRDEEERPHVLEGSAYELGNRWEHYTCTAVGIIYGCSYLRYTGYGKDRIRFVGRPDNVEACEATIPYVLAQVEAQYKAHLPRGLSKKARADYRKSFKNSCAVRLIGRAKEIVEEMTTSEGEVEGSTALVVLNHREQLDAEIADFFEERDVQSSKSRALKINDSNAASQGYQAASNVNLNRPIED